MADWLDRSLSEIGAGLRDGSVTAAALFDEAEARHDRGERLMAYKLWDGDGARRMAAAADAAFAVGADLGPLQGLPVSIKDLYGVDNLPCFAGTPKRLPPAWERDGPLVAALRRQLAVLTGKTHTVEFAFGGLGTNVHWGTPRNPWDPETHRTPGGSSSGAGVSLAEGGAVLAIGSDTAGSVRVPASMTGCVGLKTSAGRWSTDGIVPLSPSLDTPGILARSADDIATAFAALDPQAYGNRPAERPIAGLRLGVPESDYWEDASPGVTEAVRQAMTELEKAGATLVTHDLPQTRDALDIFRQGGLAAADLLSFIRRELPDWLDTLDANVRARVAAAEDMPVTEYLDRRARLHALARDAEARLADIDALLTPTVPITPPALTEIESIEGYRRANMLALRNTSPGNLLRLCAITIPVGLDAAGMPVGMQLTLRHGADDAAVGIGLAAERCLGTAVQRLGRPRQG